ncbi:MAG: AAA family ATPase [Candidatus Eisenbacteria bacterium]|uniref:AAA family ATPase n=1 Tax=Eiseniibacteriota bacterium TaxID=2212470 RepID=A0A7Y2H2L5_UNCEI|nr:AAA family ATPase [Candidatus Eisenbacteria bacterium]
MRLDEIKISGIGGFSEPTTFRLQPGTNVLLGPNGSGKTAITWALVSLFGEAPGSNNFVREDASSALVEIEASHQGQRVLVRKDLVNDTGLVHLHGEDTPRYEGAASEPGFTDCLGSFFGEAYLGFWQRFGFMMQNAETRDLLEEAVSPLDDSDVRVMEDIEREMEYLVGGEEEASMGQVQILQEELSRKENALANWGKTSDVVASQKARLEELEEEVEDAEQSAEAREEVYANLTRFYELSQERVRMQGSLQGLRDRRDAVKRDVEAFESARRALEEDYGDFLNAGTELEDALQVWTDGTNQLHEVQRKIHLARQNISNTPKPNTSRKGLTTGLGLGGVGYLGCLGAGAGDLGMMVGPLLAIMGFGAVWAKNRSVEMMHRSRREEIESLEEEEKSIERLIEDAKKNMGKLGTLGHPMSIRRGVIQYWKARERITELRERRDAHPPLSEVIDDYEDRLEQLRVVDKESKDLVARASYLAGMNGAKDSLAGEVDMAKSQSEMSRSRADRLSAQRDQLRKEIRELQDETPSRGHMEREADDLRERFSFQQNRAEAFELALGVLQEVSESHREGFEEAVCEAASGYLSTFTNNSFTAVRLGDERELEISGPNGDWETHQHLSGGVKDKLDLALMLATSSLVAEGDPWPVVLDERFLLWDRNGLEDVKASLRAYTEQGGQVLLLTHDDSFGSWCESPIQISGSSAPSKEAA